jgi:hypothetical protein
MCINNNRNRKLSDAYLVLGSEYYTLARYAAREMYMPICATLFHHSLEMLLKGYLILFLSSRELKRVGHNLSELWKIYKEKTKDTTLSRYDTTISHLNDVETIRYPDSIVDKKFALHVSFGSVSPILVKGIEKVPNYYIDVLEIDTVVINIFTACSVEPKIYFQGAPSELLRELPEELL